MVTTMKELETHQRTIYEKLGLLCGISKQAGEAGGGGGEVAWWEKKDG